MSKRLFIVVPSPGYYGDRATVVSSHATLDGAQRACTWPGVCVRAATGDKRKGSQWLRVYEEGNPILFQRKK